MATTPMQSCVSKPTCIPTGTGFRSLNFFHETVNWDQINNDLINVNWNDIFLSESINELYQRFCAVLLETCKKYVPPRKIFAKRAKIPRDRRILMKKRLKLRKKLISNPRNPQRINNELEQIEEQIALSHRAELAANEKRALEAIKKNSKYFFTYARSKSIIKTGIGPFTSANTLVEDPKDKAELLRAQFESVFTISNDDLTQQEIAPNGPSLTDIIFTEENIRKALNSIDNSSAAGQDGDRGITSCLLP